MDSRTHLDLCTGIGGFHLAAEWAGFRTVGFSEIEPYCCELLAEKWPEIKNYGDLRTADFGDLRGTITVLSVGVPCQPSSVAGKRRGAADNRWLWPAVLNVVGYINPAWAIFENPYGVLSLWDMQVTFARLAKNGYAARCFCVPACSIGAPHIRNRVFIVANSDIEQLAQWKSKSGHDGQKRQAITGGPGPEFNTSLLREVHGVRNRRDRIKALGNSVCPQQAYPFFAAIAQVLKT
jgi:DNA (cytosine-5)-methyltransferase 1